MTNPLRTNTRSMISLPIFLTPAFAETRTITAIISKSRLFSSSSSHENQKKTSGKNKQRGVSALRSTGPRTQMTLSKYLVLPQPAKNTAARRAEFDEGNETHGLWKFFNADKSSMIPPLDEGTHGRAWASKELRKKDYTDLWKLYWICAREANQIVTRQNERERMYAGYGSSESETRLKTVKRTQFRIRKVLLERHDEYTVVKSLLETRKLRELFPDAEVQLGLHESIDQDHQTDVQINEIIETSDMQEQVTQSDAAQTEHGLGSDNTSTTTTERSDTSRRQKLTE